MTTIPKIIHQIWLGPRRPPVHWMETVRQNHPTWEYMLWTEKNMPHLRNQRQFDRTELLSAKADILRYEVLYEYGGVYLDADIYCLKPLDPLLDAPMFAAYEGKPDQLDLVANSIIGAYPHHPDMNRIIEGIHPDTIGFWLTTGPLYLTEMIERYQMQIQLHPSHFFYPIHGSQSALLLQYAPTRENFPDSYTIQYWGATTHAYRQWDRFAKRLYHNTLRRYYNSSTNEYDIWFDRMARQFYRRMRARDDKY